MKMTPTEIRDYEIMQNGAGWVELPDRSWIELTGDDRNAFLHNLCTADIKAMKPAQATELFILDSRGKTFGFGHVLALEDRLLITLAGKKTSVAVCEHLDRYLIREKVQINNKSNHFTGFFARGLLTESQLQADVSLLPNAVQRLELEFENIVASNVELAGQGVLFVVSVDNASRFSEWICSRQFEPCTLDALHKHRIEQGTPWFGIEIDVSNLPQEMRRDEVAISFTKGCYLGQETVAKIDAFGHVNKFLVGLQFEGPTADTPSDPKTEIMVQGSKVGTLKSSTYSPGIGKMIGLGFVKRKFADPGTEVQIGSANAKVVELPMLSTG